MSERDELVENIRYAHEHSQQRVWGSLIFKDAADQIERDGREIERLRKALHVFASSADRRRRKDWLGGVCFQQDVLLAARAALNGEGET